MLLLRVRLLAAFTLASTLTLLLGLFATGGVRQAGQLVVDMFGHALMSTSYARSAAAEFAFMDAAAARWSAATDPDERALQRQRLDDLAAVALEDLEIARDRAATPAASAAAVRASDAVRFWMRAAAAKEGRLAELTDDTNEKIDVLVNLLAGEAFRQRQTAEATIGALAFRTGLATMFAMVFGVAAAFLLARQLLGPVRAASDAATAIAAGELDTSVPAGGDDEMGALLVAMATMRDSIKRMIEKEAAGRQDAQERLVDAMEGSTEGIVLIDAAGQVAAANARALELLPAGSIDLRPGGQWTRALVTGIGEAAVEQLGADRSECRRPDGGWVRVSCSPALSGGGFVAILSDITGLKRQEELLAEANTKIQAALTNMTQGLCMVDPAGKVIVCNDRFCDMFGLPPAAELAGVAEDDLFTRMQQAERFPPNLIASIITHQRAEAPDNKGGSFTRSAPSGEALAITCDRLAGGGWIATYEDVSALRRAEREVAYMAHHDPLTRLANRAMLRERLEQAVAELGRGRSFAVFCADLRHFKAVNHVAGSAVGDRILCASAERLLSCVREVDAVARLGGDEFAILQTNVAGHEAAELLAGRVMSAFATPIAVDDESFTVGIDLGIALAPTDAHTPERLMRLADAALFRAKQDAGSTYRFFEPDMDRQLELRRRTELELETAIETDQLVLYYQPLVDHLQRQVTSFEALIRWNSPDRGLVPPSVFIPLAEETGLITRLGEWVLHRACSDAVKWPSHVKVGVNVSPLQFAAPGLVDAVMSALHRSGLPAERLELEITESVLLQESAKTLGTLHQLHDVGVKIAMDDFGTGYSSLSYLRSFPFHKIKIDKSFVDDVSKSGDAKAIIGAIVGLGHNLRMRITAEGVETAAQLDELLAQGCDEIQGYLFGRPTAVAEVDAVIARISATLRESGLLQTAA